ncbi:MAG: cytochrome c oxidase assembly factor Coa1 family protein [Pirellulaceae bacterium]
MDQPIKKTWWMRNWKWAVPTFGILLPVLGCGGFVAGLVALVFGMIKSTDVYTDSLAAVQASPQVRAAIGEPIEPSFLVGGNVNLEGSSGHADIVYHVSGPDGGATVYAVADKSAGQWRFTTLFSELDETGERIPLVAPSRGNLGQVSRFAQ